MRRPTVLEEGSRRNDSVAGCLPALVLALAAWLTLAAIAFGVYELVDWLR